MVFEKLEQYKVLAKINKEDLSKKLTTIGILSGLIILITIILFFINFYVAVLFFIVSFIVLFVYLYQKMRYYNNFIKNLQENYKTIIQLTKMNASLPIDELISSLRNIKIKEYKLLFDYISYYGVSRGYHRVIEETMKRFKPFPYIEKYLEALLLKAQNRPIVHYLNFLSSGYYEYLIIKKSLTKEAENVDILILSSIGILSLLVILSGWSLKNILSRLMPNLDIHSLFMATYFFYVTNSFFVSSLLAFSSRDFKLIYPILVLVLDLIVFLIAHFLIKV